MTGKCRHRVGLGLLLVLLVTATLRSAGASPALPAVRAKFAPTFLHQVLQAKPADTFRFLVSARGKDELASIPTALSGPERRAAVVARLQAAAATSQERLVPLLLRLKKSGSVQEFQSFWIYNGLAVQGNRAALMALAAHDDVLSIRPDRWQKWITPEETTLTGAEQAGVNWGVARIRADQVWSALGIDGTGVVVATIDTGVDWRHPTLQPAYRGWHGGTPIHAGNWYDATDQGAVYPVDSMGHGTHVMGLLTGQDGIGVAPGARWIAVRAFDNYGYALDSWIHAGFQWLLAPAGDAALSPDIVNNSWSNPTGGNEEFQPDVKALVTAGILPVFSSGNHGPEPGSIGSPASYPDVLAAGASDPDDQVAAFSGRGPSPFVDIKPEIVAPGVNLLSALPGGAFGEMSGTSMASPLVAGTAALLNEAGPSLTAGQLVHAITSTAIPLGDSWPNPDAGWGRVDALAAVASVLNPGYLEGTVRGSDVGPLEGATVRAAEHGGGATAGTETGQEGEWSLALAVGVYDVQVSAFGYAPDLAAGLAVVTGTVTRQDFTLSPLPSGRVAGQAVASGSGQPLPAVVRVAGAPVTATAGMNGAFALSLPAGSYTLTAEHWGHRVGQATVDVAVDTTTQQDFALDTSPTLLLVDSGSWYYGSEIGYFQTALDDSRYLYHNRRIRPPLQDTPTVTDLLPYDAVIWSSPADSPGYVGAGEVISDYLKTGGSLFLSGQDVGFWDSGANGTFWSPYYSEMLKVDFLADDAESLTLKGATDGPLEGLTLTLNGLESATNQTSPDSVAPLDSDHSSPLLDYANAEGYGGIAASLCLPYRSFYLSVGLEGMEGRANRAEVMGRALDWFVSPRPTVGVELIRPPSSVIQTPGWAVFDSTGETWLAAPAGTMATHTLRLRNTGEAGIGDRYTLSLAGANWTTTILTPTNLLEPCETTKVLVTVDIPAGLGPDQTDRVVLTARSTVSPTLVATAALHTKTPAPILLVDDDRWYDQEAVYQAALQAGGFRFDRWDADRQSGGLPGAPPTSTLTSYPLVVWFTGYDWYAPITDQEAAGLEDYLARGGRLFLSSQDVLYYQASARLSQHYLGVLAHGEDVTPTLALPARGGSSDSVGGRLDLPGPLTLDYPFRNFSDGLIPTGDAVVELYSDTGWAMALTRSGAATLPDGMRAPNAAEWRTTFFSFPFESLPLGFRPHVMDRIVGWMSWLGNSEFKASARVIPAGERLTITAVLRNDGPEPATVSFDNPLPVELDLIPSTLIGGSYDGQTVYWQGRLPSGGEHVVQYTGTASGNVSSTAVISYSEHDLAFHRQVRVWTDAPDLSPSVLQSEPPDAHPGRPVTYTLLLHNRGLADATTASVAWTLPAEFIVLTGTLQATAGTPSLSDRTVRWEGRLAAGDTITLDLVGLAPPGLERTWLSSTAALDDGVTEILTRSNVLQVRPGLVYLPILTH